MEREREVVRSAWVLWAIRGSISSPGGGGAREGDLFPEGVNRIFSGGISGGVVAQQVRFIKTSR